MRMRTLYILLLWILLCIPSGYCQYPQYILYNSENGFPCDEVYSIVQDNKGMIWIGCDAGLYKYDGVGYSKYVSSRQNSQPISTLTLSESGRIYCVNFQD